jgi:GR25 family glycosyltransferase involved in LPS biosynthesis
MKKDKERLNNFKKQIDDKFKYQIVEGVDCNSLKYKDKFELWKNNNLMCQDIRFDNFDWNLYLNNYPDLKKNINNKNNAWKHWLNHGIKELRSCVENKIVNKGQWGCLESHINILKDAIEKKYKTILILEDDVLLCKDFNTQIKRIIKIQETNRDWSIIYTGASQHNWENIEFQKDFYYAKNSTGSFSYIVHMSFFQILLEKFEKRLKPVDNYLEDIQEKYYKTIFVLFPNIIICNLEESNIGNKRDNTIWFNKFKWNCII